MSDLFSEDVHRPRAERYAAALAQAASAEERIKTLTEALADHEWHRTQAESQLSCVEADETFGKVWTLADGEPPMEVLALLDLISGCVYVRATGGFDNRALLNQWVKADRSQRGQTRQAWPIADAGPFIAFRDDWQFAAVIRDARASDEAEDRIRACLRSLDGYDEPEGHRWRMPELAGAVERVVAALQGHVTQTISANADQAAEIRRLQRRLEEFEAAEVSKR